MQTLENRPTRVLISLRQRTHCRRGLNIEIDSYQEVYYNWLATGMTFLMLPPPLHAFATAERLSPASRKQCQVRLDRNAPWRWCNVAWRRWFLLRYTGPRPGPLPSLPNCSDSGHKRKPISRGGGEEGVEGRGMFCHPLTSCLMSARTNLCNIDKQIDEPGQREREREGERKRERGYRIKRDRERKALTAKYHYNATVPNITAVQIQKLCFSSHHCVNQPPKIL